MRKSIQILLGLSALLFVGCGTAIDSGDLSSSVTTLEARSLPILEDNNDNVYYGECKYIDGSSAAMAVKISDPLESSVGFVYFKHINSGTIDVFSAPNNGGDISYSPSELTLSMVSINLNESGTAYTGIVDDGVSADDCQVRLGLDARTYEDLNGI